MTKSDKEMKNNSLHHSNLLKPPIKCHICECHGFPGLVILSKRKKVLGRIQTPVKSEALGQT